MVLVHGSFGDHTAWAVPAAELRRWFTVFAMDRRGYGASADGAEYDIERDFEDVSAVIHVAAERAGEAASVWGHSYGAACAMGGAARSTQVHRLVLYEPSLGLTYPPGALVAAEAALAEGDRETAVERMLVDALEMSDEEVAQLRAGERWPNLLAGAHTAPRECRVEESWTYEPGRFRGITAPTLFLIGTESPASLVDATRRAADAIPGSRIEPLEGHGHFAHRTDPALVVSMIREFCAA